jgi:RNA polymerase sigma-70 factor, ECF subfamily
VSKDKEPPTDTDGDLTLMLKRMKDGDRQAGETVVARVYGELHRIAAREMRRERPGHTLQTTALIHEAYLRLAGAGAPEIHNRGHFFAVASQQMRRVLVDHARASGSLKRGGAAARVDLDSVRVGAVDPDAQLVRLDDALSDLERLDPRPAKVVELKYFGGYTDREVAETLDLSVATVRRDWEFARSWLFDQMSGPSPR